MKKIATIILILATFTACQKGEEKQETAVSSTNTTDTEATKLETAPAPVGFTATVNDLRLREKPTMDAKVVASLKQGDKMTGTGNASTEKVTAELRGQKTTDVFYEVTTTSGVKGWVFGGGVAKEGTAAATNNADVWLVTKDKVGKISATSTEEDLVQMFGKSNITQEKEIYANADIPPFSGVSIFKGKADEIEIAWAEGKKGKKIETLFIRKEGGQWHTAEGIKVGSTLADLARINGKSFDFSGFGWDYGGYVSDWKKGKLDNTGVSIRLDVDGDIGNKYLGEVVIKSNDPTIAKAKISVSELSINFE